ncbi:GDSL-like Lipase/Acylhydrolase family protein [Frankineae bacterium MT45]|nr:GDSL-like Lipase/Acylhydrolase family protein [Frankineae bacterium MT45]
MSTQITKPTVGGDAGSWGAKNNAALDALAAAQVTPTAVMTAAHAAVAGEMVLSDASAGTFTHIVPTAAAAGMRVGYKKVDTSVNAVILQLQGSDVFNRAGGGQSLTLRVPGHGVTLTSAGGGVWTVDSSDIPLAQTDLRYANTLVNPNALSAWKAGLASRDTARCNILWIGDSITQGYNAGTPAARFVQRATKQLAAKYPVQAGNPAGGYWYPAQYITSPDNVPTLTGTNSQAYYGGPGLSSVVWSVTNGSIQWTVQGTSAKVTFMNDSGGDYNYLQTLDTVAGGGGSILQQTGSTILTTKTFTFAGGSGSHTLKIAQTGGVGHMRIAGVQVFDGDETVGIYSINGGHSTISASVWVGNDASFNGTGQSWMAAAGALYTPSLIVINLGVNDYLSSLSDSPTFKANLQTIIAKYRLGAPNCSYLLVANYEPYAGSATLEPWQNYVSAMRSVAMDDPTVAFYDLSRIMPVSDTTNALGLYHTDKVHPGVKGHQFIADQLANIL